LAGFAASGLAVASATGRSSAIAPWDKAASATAVAIARRFFFMWTPGDLGIARGGADVQIS
jgi:hypothetical protein